MKNILFALLVFLTISCGGSKEENINPIKFVDKVEDCPLSCKKLNDLSCQEGKDLIHQQSCDETISCDEGSCVNGQCVETCVEFCEFMIENGATLNIKCWQTINSCEEIDKKCRQPV